MILTWSVAGDSVARVRIFVDALAAVLQSVTHLLTAQAAVVVGPAVRGALVLAVTERTAHCNKNPDQEMYEYVRNA